ncbi:gigaxonin-like [Saccoglossus kowalevskii]
MLFHTSLYHLFSRSLFNYDIEGNAERKQIINLDTVSPLTFGQILDYIYTAEVVLDDNNVQDIFQSADVLLLADLKQLCCEYLEKCISPENCIGIRNFTERYYCQHIHYLATECMETNFLEVCRNEEFLQQPLEKVKEILSRDQLQTLSRKGEEVIFEAVMSWVRHDLTKRSPHMIDLLTCVRFHLVSPSYYAQYVIKDDLIAKNPSCKKMIDQMYCDKLTTRTLKVRGYFDAIVAVGGQARNNVELLSTVRCAVPYTNQPQWLDFPAMSTGRVLHSVVSAGGFLFVIGGTDVFGKPLDTGEKYDPQTNSWSAITPMLQKRHVFGLVTIDNHIYAIGGCEDENIKTMEAYNIYNDTWEMKPPMQITRRKAAYTTMQKKIYVIGGDSGGQPIQPVDTVECFDPLSQTWSIIAPLKERRFQAFALGVYDRIYVFGGYRNLLCPSAQNDLKFCHSEVYNTERHGWETLPNDGMCTMTTSSGLNGVVHIQGNIYVIGHLDTGHTYQCVRFMDENGWGGWKIAITPMLNDQLYFECAALRIPCSLYHKMVCQYGSQS